MTESLELGASPVVELQQHFISSFNVTLRLKARHSFPFYHGAELYSLLSSVLQLHPLGTGVILYPCESGRIYYESGNRYNFGVLILDREFASTFIDRLTTGFRRQRTTGNRLYHIAELEQVTCLGTQTELTETEEIPRSISLRFIAPLRLARKDPPKGKQFFDPGFFDPERFVTLLAERMQRLKDEFGWGFPIPITPQEMEVTNRSFLWMDVPFSKTLGGIVGGVDIACNFSMEQFNLLRLGQLLGAGNNTSFGFGAYRIVGHKLTLPISTPAESILHTALNLTNLKKAVWQLRKSEVGYHQSEKLRNVYDDQLRLLADEVISGGHSPSNLSGIVLSEGEKTKVLSFPPLNDLLLQQAVVQVIGNGIDTLIEECGFAFRNGLSRKTALRAIRNAFDEGFRWMFITPLASFYDNVQWEKIEGKIESLFHSNPELISLLREWIKASVWHNGKLIRRERGLPQGPISSLLAYLLLDEFDVLLSSVNLRLIRYGYDDFFILCRDQNPIITESKLSSELLPSYGRITAVIFLQNWLSLQQPIKLQPIISILPTEQNNSSRALHQPGKRPCFIKDADSSVHIEDNKLVIAKKNSETVNNQLTIDLSSIESVTFFCMPIIAMDTVHRLRVYKVPVYFCRPNGEILLNFNTEDKSASLRELQEELSANEYFRVQFCQKLLNAKLENMYRTSIKYGAKQSDAEELARLASSALRSSSITNLRTMGNRGDFVYYNKLFRGILPDKWDYQGRKGHTAPDPVNALLSFGYAILRNYLATLLIQADLEPNNGWFNIGRSDGLVKDVMEPYRAFIDDLVLQSVTLGKIKTDDFIMVNNNRFPYIIEASVKEHFLSVVVNRLFSASLTGEGDTVNTLLEDISATVKQVGYLVRNQASGHPLYFSRI